MAMRSNPRVRSRFDRQGDDSVTWFLRSLDSNIDLARRILENS